MLGRIKSYILVRSCKLLNSSIVTQKNSPLNPTNVLIINPQGIGDMIIFTPVIEAIKRKNPSVKISVLTSEYGAQVLKNNPSVYETIIIPYPLPSFFFFVSLIKRLRKKKYDTIIDTTLTCFFLTQLLLPYCIGASTRICFQRKGFSHFLPTHEILFTRNHMMDVYGTISKVFETSIQPIPLLYPSLEDKITIQKLLKNNKKPFIIIHPTCQGDQKIWPAENFSEIITKIKRKISCTIIVTTTTREKHLIEPILKNHFDDIIVLLPENVQMITALLEASDFLISVDTGIVHIATATNTPTLCIYGRTSQLFWKPYNSNQKAIQKEICRETANALDTDQIIIYPLLCPEHKTDCIHAVKVSDVWKIVEKELMNL